MNSPVNQPFSRDALRGRVAVVAGATRGAGRGIAAALGEAGATVICTGRTSSVRKIPSDYDRSETIEETAALVTSLGGNGIAVPMDHLVPEEVQSLADRLRAEFGKIDIPTTSGAQIQGIKFPSGNMTWR
jgi:NAD(P)-dependent dehydrogenase (short-subunit alcohol dehydrogenase family)